MAARRYQTRLRNPNLRKPPPMQNFDSQSFRNDVVEVLENAGLESPPEMQKLRSLSDLIYVRVPTPSLSRSAYRHPPQHGRHRLGE